MREELCKSSIANTLQILDSYDPALAELFRKMAESFCYENQKNNDGFSSQVISTEFPSVKMVTQDSINIIPGSNSHACYKYCVAFADGKWGQKNGFLKISRSLVSYWFKCEAKNTGTLLYTSSWDERSFKAGYKNDFDTYIGKGKTLAVVLVTSTGFSV